MLVKEGPNLADDPLAYCNWYARAFHELQLRLYVHTRNQGEARWTVAPT